MWRQLRVEIYGSSGVIRLVKVTKMGIFGI